MLTKEQLQERKTGIGGSDSAIIFGESSFKTPLELYLNKIGEIEDEDLSGNERVNLGNILEPIIIKEYEKQSNVVCSSQQRTMRSTKYPWMIANIDSWINDKNAILEAKTMDYRIAKRYFGEEYTDEMPTPYLLQCAHYAIVGDDYVDDKINYVDLMAFIYPSFKLYRYERNSILEQQIIEKTEKFWKENVVKKIPPLPTSNKEVLMLYGKDDNSTYQAGNLIIDCLKKLHEIKDQMKDLKLDKDIMEVRLKNAMGHAAVMCDDCGQVLATWKAQSSKRVDVQRLKVEYQDIYDELLKETQTRVFRLKSKELI